MKYILPVLVFVTSFIKVSLCDDLPCALRQTQFGGVCVCNASYCDTIERPPPLGRGLYYHYTTSSDSPGFHRTTGSFTKDHFVDNQTMVFFVNPSIKYQEIFGFGGAFTDSTGAVVNSLPLGAQDKFIESYFGKSGIEFSMGRIPIGATDFSPRMYTYDDVPDDKELKYFNLTEEDFKFKIPLINKALGVSPHRMKLVGSIFSAPKWMKLNDTWRAAYINDEYYDAWSRYHIKFLDAYAENGITFWSLTGGNEVMLDLEWHGCLVIATGAMPHNHIRWMRDHLVPLLQTSNHTDIKLFIMDDVRLFAKFWMSRFAQDRQAYQIVDGIALHWYFDWIIPDPNYTAIAEEFHNLYPDKLVLYTESSINVIFTSHGFRASCSGDFKSRSYSCVKDGKVMGIKEYYFEEGPITKSLCYVRGLVKLRSHSCTPTDMEPKGVLSGEGEPVELGSWERGAFYIYSIIKNLNLWTSGYVDWNLALDTAGGPNLNLPTDAAVIVNASSGEFYKNPIFYGLGHFSKFILPGSKRVDVQTNKQPSTAKTYQHSPELMTQTIPGGTLIGSLKDVFPPPKLPQDVFCVATINPDNSSSVIVLNTMDIGVNVTVVDMVSGYITATITANSINTFVYWPNEP